MKEGRARTLDAKLDEIGVDVRRVANHVIPALEERRRCALVEQTVLQQAKVFQAIPLGTGLGVL